MSLDRFSEITREWFSERFREPTDIQAAGWQAIFAGESTLLAAPTGSGKTLAAFLVSIDRLLQRAQKGTLPVAVQTLYVSPLKALSNDIHRNLEVPLSELSARAEAAWGFAPGLRSAVRTGDTPAAARQKMLRHPPHLLVTTPESLYLILTSKRSRDLLKHVETVIVDEIHALARDKRGSHLSLTLERLDEWIGVPTQRVGISATQKPLTAMAGFLVGQSRSDGNTSRACTIIDMGHGRARDLNIELPTRDLSAVCSKEHWNEIHDRLVELIESHRATMIFVNTRKLAERVSYHLAERLGKDHVTSHHGSLAKEHRLDTEARLKSGELKAVVATASLELGIDVGYIDLVCQIGSPRSIATFLQRVGRSGHSLGAVPKGRLLPLTRDELVESVALLRSIRAGVLDIIEIPSAPLDVLAQQIVAMAAHDEWDEDQLCRVVCRAFPYRALARKDFDSILGILSERASGGVGRGTYLHRDPIARTVRGTRGAGLAAASSGGAIPENADYRVVLGGEGTFIGTVNEDFAIESMSGDIFLLGNTSWRIERVQAGEVIVQDAGGASPTIPFWLGEAPGRTFELSQEIARLRRDLGQRLDGASPDELEPAIDWLVEEVSIDRRAASQTVAFIAAQKASLGIVPDDRTIVFERFFDEMGGQQLVIHSPLGTRINRAWGLALRKRFCRSFDFELQASADDDGIVLSLGPQHSFPIENLFGLLTPRNGREILEQAILDAPLFKARWRWNATRSLAVLRQRGGKRVPPPLQRFRSDDLLTAVFPASTACLENRPENIDIPDHPIVRQTMEDCLFEATDLARWLEVLEKIERGEIELVGKETREPSPFCHERLNSRPYAFLDNAPLEERRARAVSYRRTLSTGDDLSALDPEAMAQAEDEIWPQPRDERELLDFLRAWVVLPESCITPATSNSAWLEWLFALHQSGRVSRMVYDTKTMWIAHECWPVVRGVYPSARVERTIDLPEHLEREVDSMTARALLVRGWMETLGPITARALSETLGLSEDAVERSLEMLEAEGCVMRGTFRPNASTIEWCDRRTLARIHRYTIAGFRRRLEPMDPALFLTSLLANHGFWFSQSTESSRSGGPGGLQPIVERLAGFEAPAGSWEADLFPSRLESYDPAWLDQLTWTGEVAWGRLEPPTPPASKPDRRWTSGLSRTVPISLFPRGDLAWLLPPGRSHPIEQTRGDARAVWEILRDRGALFPSDLASLAQLLPSQLDQALGELASLGLITADGYASIRSIVHQRSGRPARGSRRSSLSRHSLSSGRWSIFPQTSFPAIADDVRAEHWAGLLLKRYRILFRDLLDRETAAPPWWRIAAILRQWEAQGKVQGGRFLKGCAGEQFALSGEVEKLRAERDAAHERGWTIVSKVDPLNLVGIITDESRLPATAGHAFAWMDGKVVGTHQSGQTSISTEIPLETRQAMAATLPLPASLRSRPHRRERSTVG